MLTDLKSFRYRPVAYPQRKEYEPVSSGMTEDKLERYKKAYYSRPEILASLEDKVNRLCEATESSSWLDTVHWTFELLLITIHTDKGQAMYLKLLNRIAPHFPDRAEKYRAVFNDRKNQAGKP